MLASMSSMSELARIVVVSNVAPERNIEVGVVLHAARLAVQLRAEFERLIEVGVLRAACGPE